MKKMFYMVFAIAVVAAGASHAATPPAAEVDKVFAAWDRLDTPGAAVAVVRDGKIVYSRGYGLANLEYDVKITPSTVFHAASISKQFTAFSIHLLADEGKLALDDEVRKHVPEMRLQGPQPTLRQLMHHTGGVRDQWSLLTMAGLRMDDVITDGDIQGLLLQQRQLNFRPGEEELYSNGGYGLLAMVVQRVSGKPLAQFARERIFEPLGMASTRFQENYGVLVKNRAYSYGKSRDGSYRYLALSFSNVGATSLFTTVEDLARWNANFDEPRVGNRALLERVIAPGKLNDGRLQTYASGLAVAPYRGVPVVEHGGADAGFRGFFMRLPQQKMAIIVLGNAAEINAHDVTRRVADLYLEGEPGVQAPPAWPAEVELQARDLAPYLGDYEVQPGRLVTFFAQNQKLFAFSPGSPPTPLLASAPNQFYAKSANLTVSFPAVVGNEPAPAASYKQGQRELALKRLSADKPSADALKKCEGEYYSDELRTIYALTARDGKLAVRYPRGVLEMRPVNADVHVAGYPLGTFVLKRDAYGSCQGFTVTAGRVRDIGFRRIQLTP